MKAIFFVCHVLLFCLCSSIPRIPVVERDVGIGYKWGYIMENAVGLQHCLMKRSSFSDIDDNFVIALGRGHLSLALPTKNTIGTASGSEEVFLFFDGTLISSSLYHSNRQQVLLAARERGNDERPAHWQIFLDYDLLGFIKLPVTVTVCIVHDGDFENKMLVLRQLNAGPEIAKGKHVYYMSEGDDCDNKDFIQWDFQQLEKSFVSAEFYHFTDMATSPNLLFNTTWNRGAKEVMVPDARSFLKIVTNTDEGDFEEILPMLSFNAPSVQNYDKSKYATASKLSPCSQVHRLDVGEWVQSDTGYLYSIEQKCFPRMKTHEFKGHCPREVYQPLFCEISRPTSPVDYCKLIENRNVLFVGDSLMLQQTMSLISLTAASNSDACNFYKASSDSPLSPSVMPVCNNKATIRYIPNFYLTTEDTVVPSCTFSNYSLQYQWDEVALGADIIVVNAAAHIQPPEAYTENVRNAARVLSKLKERNNARVFFATTASGIYTFSKTIMATSPETNFTRKIGQVPSLDIHEQFGWERYPYYNQAASEIFLEEGHEVLDVAPALNMRKDGRTDHIHWAIPGHSDLVLELLYHFLQQGNTNPVYQSISVVDEVDRDVKELSSDIDKDSYFTLPEKQMDCDCTEVEITQRMLMNCCCHKRIYGNTHLKPKK